ncbi:ATP-binding cassette domain-containing protein [Enterococcus dongliensis]|uniref:ATP-binding cassette domain-containing protein n=1 Tax=Enterococcus dongliensis TaxID=2559925 RepID=UPI00288E4B38|nr:ATP-binding cassette domain-containing protein [Enterococcus dongliensis]MDT2674205.1 ATP-binding cassette domain-containing protein [Enterococcus dongliensis]
MTFENDIVLKATNVTKLYGQAKALDNVSLEIKRGMIYGLIGENGAGKSTFMRTIMGLISVDKGEIELFQSTNLQKARRRMGQSIETPALYPELSAKDNLKIQAANGGVSDREVDDLLKLMRLEHTGKKKTKNFSLGMRQRLAIASTLITNPEFLILDEPTNGMDPAGIVEMREIILRLVKERGMTVLLSSHLLDELSQIATHYGILHKGRLIKELSKEELSRESRQFVKIESPNVEKVVRVLDQLGYTDYHVQSNQVVQLFEGINQIPLLTRSLVEAGIEVEGVHAQGQKLEDYFLQITGGVAHV